MRPLKALLLARGLGVGADSIGLVNKFGKVGKASIGFYLCVVSLRLNNQ